MNKSGHPKQLSSQLIPILHNQILNYDEKLQKSSRYIRHEDHYVLNSFDIFSQL